MADGVTIDNGSLTDFTAATDDCGASGHVPLVKLAYSANGDATAVTADSSGLKVQDTSAVALLTTMDADTSYLPGMDADTSLLSAATQAIDTAVGSTDRGVVVVAVRDNALTTLTPAEGDAAPLRVDTNGALWVQLAGALASTTDSIAIKPPATQVKKSYNTTSQQTGADVWSPGSGKKIRVSNLIIGTYGTTAGRLILWFGANADTTYSEGTDEALFKASFAPSATAKPGAVVTFTPPFEAGTADHELHITTDAALSVDIVVVGYEE